MQQMNSDPRRKLYEAALAAPVFDSPPGESWALLPRGTSPGRPVPLGSKAYQSWLCAMSEEKLGLLPTPAILNSTIKARHRDSSNCEDENRQVALRMFRTAGGDIHFHLGCDSGHCLKITNEGWEVEDTPDYLHFRYPETRLPIPKPIHANTSLQALLAQSMGEDAAEPLTKWLIKTICQVEPAGPLLITGEGRHRAALSLVSLLDARHVIMHEPNFEDDWLLLYAELSLIKGGRLDRLNFYAIHRMRPVVITSERAVAGLEVTHINVSSVTQIDIATALGALASAVSAAIRAPLAASLSPSQL